MPDSPSWIDRTVEVTGWRHEPEEAAGWEQVEAALGVALPGDFKELCRRFARAEPAAAGRAPFADSMTGYREDRATAPRVVPTVRARETAQRSVPPVCRHRT